MKTIRSIALLASAGLALALAACGGGQPDIHDAPREAKPYEAVDVASLDQTQLLSHLDEIRQEALKAIESKQYVEFHHLEAALTATLEQLEPAVQDNVVAASALTDLKNLALQLHAAGHNMNAAIADKLGPKIDELSTTIIARLQADAAAE